MRKSKKKTAALSSFEIMPDLHRVMKINVADHPNLNLSPFAFGTAFTNSLEFADDNLQKMKKEILPRIGTVVKTTSGEKYKFVDIRVMHQTVKNYEGNDEDSLVYIFEMEEA